eukprot:c1852_g1_i1 orf=165-344(-)
MIVFLDKHACLCLMWCSMATPSMKSSVPLNITMYKIHTCYRTYNRSPFLNLSLPLFGQA